MLSLGEHWWVGVGKTKQPTLRTSWFHLGAEPQPARVRLNTKGSAIIQHFTLETSCRRLTARWYESLTIPIKGKRDSRCICGSGLVYSVECLGYVV